MHYLTSISIRKGKEQKGGRGNYLILYTTEGWLPHRPSGAIRQEAQTLPCRIPFPCISLSVSVGYMPFVSFHIGYLFSTTPPSNTLRILLYRIHCLRTSLFPLWLNAFPSLLLLSVMAGYRPFVSSHRGYLSSTFASSNILRILLLRIQSFYISSRCGVMTLHIHPLSVMAGYMPFVSSHRGYLFSVLAFGNVLRILLLRIHSSCIYLIPLWLISYES